MSLQLAGNFLYVIVLWVIFVLFWRQNEWWAMLGYYLSGAAFCFLAAPIGVRVVGREGKRLRPGIVWTILWPAILGFHTIMALLMMLYIRFIRRTVKHMRAQANIIDLQPKRDFKRADQE